MEYTSPVDQIAFHDLVSGRAQGLIPTLMRSLLWLLAKVYGLAILCRTSLFCRHILPTYAPPCPVICIGNLTTGGTGKTPLVAWLCHYLKKDRLLSVTVLTRGYKSAHTKTDEPAMLEKQLGSVPVVVNADRIEGTKTALACGPVDVFVMDDGFQHLRLARDLNILTLDATNPFGYGRLLPAGLLREPMSAIQRAHCIVITRSDQISQKQLVALRERIESMCPGMALATTVHAPAQVHFPKAPPESPTWLKGRSVFAFCGIGNPQAFFTTLENLGARLVGTHAFDDHHHCTSSEFDELHQQARLNHADMLLTTEKNFPDIAAMSKQSHLPVGYLAVELTFESGEDRVKELIEQTLASRISPS
jgi:tetraacyldisaccharide 4'-kinase